MAAIHSHEFKRDAVRIAQTSVLTLRQVASDLGIGFSILGTWVRVFSEKAKVPAQDAELLRENGIIVERTRKFKAATDSSQMFDIAPNLLDRDFQAPEPNQK